MESPSLLAWSEVETTPRTHAEWKIKVTSKEGKKLASSKKDNEKVLNFGNKEPRFHRSFQWPKAVDTAHANASGNAILISQSHAQEVETSFGNCNGFLDMNKPNLRPPSTLSARRSSEFAMLRVGLDD
ncbi:hypothetical protein Ancab_037405, partial [Ancistrocladus abbreviatus]